MLNLIRLYIVAREGCRAAIVGALDIVGVLVDGFLPIRPPRVRVPGPCARFSPMGPSEPWRCGCGFVEAEHAHVHFAHAVCDRSVHARTTSIPAHVTCPECRVDLADILTYGDESEAHTDAPGGEA